MLPQRILLDTNIIISGYLRPDSISGKILFGLQHTDTTIIMSDELLDQTRRVAKRVGGKDWAGLVIDQLWRDFSIVYVQVSDDEKKLIANAHPSIPREDVGIYLAALNGKADCMISANHEFVRQAATQQNLFESIYPHDFWQKYLAD